MITELFTWRKNFFGSLPSQTYIYFGNKYAYPFIGVCLLWRNFITEIREIVEQQRHSWIEQLSAQMANEKYSDSKYTLQAKKKLKSLSYFKELCVELLKFSRNCNYVLFFYILIQFVFVEILFLCYFKLTNFFLTHFSTYNLSPFSFKRLKRFVFSQRHFHIVVKLFFKKAYSNGYFIY